MLRTHRQQLGQARHALRRCDGTFVVAAESREHMGSLQGHCSCPVALQHRCLALDQGLAAAAVVLLREGVGHAADHVGQQVQATGLGTLEAGAVEPDARVVHARPTLQAGCHLLRVRHLWHAAWVHEGHAVDLPQPGPGQRVNQAQLVLHGHRCFALESLAGTLFLQPDALGQVGHGNSSALRLLGLAAGPGWLALLREGGQAFRGILGHAQAADLRLGEGDGLGESHVGDGAQRVFATADRGG